jgi:hypothetical protein
MSDVTVEHKVVMTRQEAVRWIAELAEALGGTARSRSGHPRRAAERRRLP